ncbi:MAG: thiamine-phosphate kinase [Deltaproteobacteria bacterium]|nr:thiamine-phosphate kinase [Deltaproteobacteria bacterium]
MPRPPAGEVGLIAALAERFAPPPPEVVLGIGDDCAALDLGGPDYLLWTLDTLVEGVHFDPAYISLKQLGRKSLAVNLSDIAAMGGEPAYALLSLGWPPDRELSAALEFGVGLAELARNYGVAVIGGDTVASPRGIMVTVAVLGRVPKAEMLTRAGAEIGDGIYVTGNLGDAAAGLEILRRGLAFAPDLAAPLLKAHLDPEPQLAAARVLAQKRLAHAVIDLSDGVATDLHHICRASLAGARLEAGAIPVSAGVEAVSRELGRNPLDLALKGGEDYQLLFTSPPDAGPELMEAFGRAGLPAPIKIGVVVSGREVTLVTASGEEIISGSGFDHFRLDLGCGKA